MSEQATTTSRRPPADLGTAELQEELARQRAEILRLRDLLVSKDAELGAAKGRVAEMDERSRRLAGLAGRLEAVAPRLGRLVGTALRLLQSQAR